jgi:hypothetical protein
MNMLDCKNAAIRGARYDAAEYREAIIATLDLFVRDTLPQSAGPSEVTTVLRSAVSQLLDGMKSLHRLASDYQDDPSDYKLQALLENVLSETEKVR